VVSGAHLSLLAGMVLGFGACLLFEGTISRFGIVADAVPVQGVGNNESPQATQPGRGRGGGFMEPAPLDFNDHDGYQSGSS
jgi:hypothetical protein